MISFCLFSLCGNEYQHWAKKVEHVIQAVCTHVSMSVSSSAVADKISSDTIEYRNLSLDAKEEDEMEH